MSGTLEGTDRTGRTAARRTPKVTLSSAFAEFWRHPSPWLIVATLLGATLARVLVGDWRLADLVAPLVFVAMFPLIEWVVHVFVLHWRPRRVGRVVLDHLLASKHRAHHRDPRDIPLVFIPWQALLVVTALTVALAWWLAPTPGSALTYVMTVALMGLVYEWTHYLVHTDYKPRGRLYKAVWRHHRLHHFKNEHYWMTVTTAHTADRLLGTDPDPATVETSPTAKRLHGLDG
jgi:hypothetical protein